VIRDASNNPKSGDGWDVPDPAGCSGRESEVTELAKIREIKRRVEDDLLRIPGVTGIDIGRKIVAGRKTEILAIRIYVEKKKHDLPDSGAIPSEIEGVPTDVIERRFVLHDTD
jgi:hypothetical protein